jgi:hypothetical protein
LAHLATIGTHASSDVTYSKEKKNTHINVKGYAKLIISSSREIKEVKILSIMTEVDKYMLK